ncbi:hypothetical protein C0995_003802 [Termitomyces sp. Mi166|nr:hypothetical protein C0995_003802 [Termitomyces sp. Mi166\
MGIANLPATPTLRPPKNKKRGPSITTESAQSPPEETENWKFNAKFLTALSQWTLQNPEDSFDRILQRVSKAIDAGKDHFNLIPDAPFPARSLIQSLAQIIQLGAKISSAKVEVRNFVMDIQRWVNGLQSSFDKAGKRGFTTRTWSNLAYMRSLIDEICDWAAARLTQSFILISEGLDAIHYGQNQIVHAIENLKKAQYEQLKSILEEQERRRFLEDELRAHAVKNITHDSQNKQPCYPGTRREILNEIQAWINDHSKDTSQNFLWLTGPPGCGKSAIAASIVQECERGNILIQFFVNRNDLNTTNPNSYFQTLTWELLRSSESLEPGLSLEHHLHDVLKRREFSVNTPDCAAELFIEAISKATNDAPQAAVVIIFDGLDETAREHLEDTATLFSQLFARLHDHPNAKVLISSRSEDAILKPFRDAIQNGNIKEIQINTSDSNSCRDVKMVLERRLTKIAMRYNLPSAVWPGDHRLEKLAGRASGLFIWAVTASNYIDMRLRHRGTEILQSVLDQFDNQAMTGINTLYREILEFSYPKVITDQWSFETFRRLLGAIIVLREPMTIGDLGDFLDLRESPEGNRVDVKNFVEHLRTLLMNGSE